MIRSTCLNLASYISRRALHSSSGRFPFTLGSDQQRLQVVVASQLQSCRDLVSAWQLHSRILASSLRSDTFTVNLLVQMYGRCGRPDIARCTFDGILPRNAFSWNILFAAYAQNGHLDEAKSIFNRMPCRDVVTWTAYMAILSEKRDIDQVKETFRAMRERNVVTWNVLVGAYSELGQLESGKDALSRMPFQNTISWNLILKASLCRDFDRAGEFFQWMPQRDGISWNIAVSAVAQSGNLDIAREMLNLMPATGIVCWTALVVSEGQIGRADEAKRVFDSMPDRDEPAGAAMVSAYAQCGDANSARSVFDAMPQHSIFAWNSLLAAFALNARSAEAADIFAAMPEKDVVSWNILLAMLSQRDQAANSSSAIQLFHSMLLESVAPNDVSHLCVLIACSRTGSIRAASDCFLSMSFDHGCKPLHLHFSCMIDLLARAGQLVLAQELVEAMPFVPDDAEYLTLTVGGAPSGTKLMDLRPGRAGPYVVVSNSIRESLSLVKSM